MCTASTKYYKVYNISTPEEINRGHCVEFAQYIILNLFGKETNSAYCVNIANFMCGIDKDPNKNEIFDEKMLQGYWNISEVPEEFKKPNIFHTGSHSWAVIHKRFYDAECPKGVDNFFDLPWFIRIKEKIKRE